MKLPELPAPTELVIVRPGSPETAGTRYLGLAEALDRTRAAQLGGLVTRRRLMHEREAALDGARVRALMAAAAYGFGWRPRQMLTIVSKPHIDASIRVQKPYIRPNLTFAHTTTSGGDSRPHPTGSGGDKTPT